MSLSGDGHSLHLNGAPADPSYVATYPVADLNAMAVTSSAVGDLTADCASGGSAVACKSLPFFTEVNAKELKVFDAYGHVVMETPFTASSDAGAASNGAGSPSKRRGHVERARRRPRRYRRGRLPRRR